MQFPLCTQVFRSPKNIISIQYVIIACIARHYHNNKHVYIVYMPDIFALFSYVFPNINKSQQSQTNPHTIAIHKVSPRTVGPFSLGLTTDTESSLGSNQTVINAEQHSLPFPLPKKATRLFGFFLLVSRLKCERLRNQWYCQRKTDKRCLQISKCHFCFRLLSRARGQKGRGKRKAIK